MENNKLQWFCKTIFDNWTDEVDIRKLYKLSKAEFPKLKQDEIIDYMSRAIKIVGSNKKYD